ncbi:alpha/beta fold hydrolase [Shimia abyssi]|uniref:Lysophospholipase n=1 Tax=Shimia abyssi TaxID=1662395 RepID=A0A2P8F5W5_9RHOB|nr:alpha/beta hydrolase [Shimia abyssi]PSL17113.1 lysophospholipase [Shimia abyssi]
MTFRAAPFYHDVAEGPHAQAWWLDTSDGVRIRAACWAHENARGTVFLFPGRTEYVEKYGRTAADFAARGFAQVAIDWRGQGLADRQVNNRLIGHVLHFDDYQKDLAAVMAMAKEQDLPRPWFLVAHSMGGCIGLRALLNNMPVNAAVFTGPMFGIRLSTALRPIAWALSWSSRHFAQSHRLAPGTIETTYVLAEPFEDNTLTTDPDMYAYMKRQMTDHPDLALGGPSLHWLFAALTECRALRTLPSPKTPSLTFLGTNERIVDTAEIHDRMSRWPNGTLEMVPNGEHEVMMDSPTTRAAIFDQCAALFAKHT